MQWSVNMNETASDSENLDNLPEPKVRTQHRLSVVWLIPLVAALIGSWLAFKAYTSKGPTITISLQSAEGLEQGHSKVKYKDVEIGKVTTIDLSKDYSRVLVTVELTKNASGLLSANSRFWVVRARISTNGVSGLGTLLSGAYIAMDPGNPGAPAKSFQGLEMPPTITTHQEGRTFSLRAEKLGSINIGSPVLFRHIRVGEVEGYELEKDGQAVEIKAFVHGPYVNLVRKDSRFWNAGGVDVTVDTSGIRMSSDSLVDMLLGGIAFESPISLDASDLAPEGQVFALFPSHDQINERIYLNRQYYVVNFHESVRGLTRGAPVEFRGIQVGQVEDIKLELSADKMEANVPVLIAIEPERLRFMDRSKAAVDSVIEGLVARGMRAQMKTGSLLTGSLYVDLDFYPKTPARSLGRHGNYREIPTVPTTMGSMISNLTKFLDRLQALPIEELSSDLRASLPALRGALEGANALMARLDKETVPQAQATLEQARSTLSTMEQVLKSDSPVQQDLQRALEEFTKAARALRDLAETLERHPESLVRGKGNER